MMYTEVQLHCSGFRQCS